MSRKKRRRKKHSQKDRRTKRRKLQMEALNPRLLLTADPVISFPNGQSTTTEDFNAGVLPSGFLATGPNVSFDPTFGDVSFNGNGNDRAFLHTEQSDFTDISFIAEVTATLAPAFGGGATGSIAFFGFGQGTPDPANDNEPTIRSINLRHFTPTLGENTEVAINYTGPGTGTIDNFSDPGPQDGTHRFRFVWDHIDQTAQFLIDEDFAGGTFSPEHISSVADVSGGEVNPANARIFFGGSDFQLFDDYQYQITKGPVDLQIIEENTFVVDVESQDSDGDGEGNGLTYSVDDTATFTIDASGNLSFVTAPIHDPLDDNIYPVTVTVTDTDGNTDIQVIFVEVEQAGNQPPEVTSQASYQNDENEAAVGSITVIDEDIVTFSLSGPDAGLFSITPTSDLSADLAFNVAPNFEAPGDSGANNVYDLTVTTEDIEGLTDDISITVTVNDINEAPTFTISPNQTLEEGDFSAAVIVTVFDPDAGDTVSTSATFGGDQPAFDFDSATQELFLTPEPGGLPPDFENPLDADASNDYEITLIAEDSAGLSDVITITVDITNVDENPTVDVPAQDGQIIVPENQALVTTPIVVSDPEDPSSSLVTFVQGADAAAFSIVNDELVFSPPANFEQPTDADADNIYEVTIGVQDTTGLDGFRNLTVQVTDVNDAPVIDSNILGAGGVIVNPIRPEGTQFIANLIVNDDDSDQLFYSVGGTDGALFEITPMGQWSFRPTAIPDFENPADANVDNVYAVTLIVSDRPDGDPDQLTDTFDTLVTIQNVNEPPVISTPADNSSIPVDENQTAVTTVVFNDVDANESHTFTLSGADAAAFSISPTGVLTLSSAPDFETPADANADNTYEVTVTVEDSTGATDVVTLSVPVNDINEAPTISGGNSASVVENATAVPITVAASDVDAGDSITFSLAGADAAVFTVNTTTGGVAFAAAPDFELPGDANTDNVYEFDIVATDSGNLTASQPVTVTVTNEIDAPTITSANTASVSENNTSGQAVVHTVTAVDSEDDLSGTPLTFAISGGADSTAFQLSPTGDLSFLAGQDFESPTDANTDNVYEVEVTVTDSDDASDVQTILVSVADLNEPPVITSSPTFSVSEGTSPIGTVTATDLDDVLLDFSITGGADAGLFTIGQASGALSLTFAPNFEAPADADGNNVYEVEVSVSDAEPLTDSQLITVTVTNTTEPPFFTSFNGNQSANVSTDENTTAVTTLTAIDQDLSADLSFTITGGADASFFQVDATTGAVSFLSAPDAESPADANTDGIYEVVVTVTDLSDGLTDTQTLNVEVANVNEAPTITSQADFSVGEGTTPITTVVVSDVDDTAHTFAITGGADAALFSVDPNTGALSLTTAPNFEIPGDSDANNVYEVEVTASDAEPLSDSQLITVTVSDTPEPPFFTSFNGNQTASTSINEGTTAVASLTAIDQDAAANLSFSITGGADDSAFQVDTTTGALAFATPPDADVPADADANNVYEVIVTVTDASDSLTDTQTLLVTVDNVNEPPVISSAAARTVGEGTTNVGPVVAVDPDDPTLDYAITGGADASLFSLNPTTGALLLTVVPNFEAPADADADNQYEVEVTVSDAEPLTDAQLITVTVSDTPEPPIITSFSGNQQASVTAAENQTAVATLTAVDQDTNANLVYSITGGADAGALQVDATTGAVSFLAAPDFESPSDADTDGVYEVAITVTDTSDGLTDAQTLLITVADANDAPTITSSNTFSVSEGTASVGTVTATDVDDTTLTFSIIGGADASLLTIDPNTGALALTIPPNFESPADADANNQYEVEVSVSDDEPASNSQTVVVVVVDTPEPPFFTSFNGNQQANVGVNENNTAVTTLTAIDQDLSADLSFTITGGADAGAFQVDATTGAVSFLNAPNFSNPCLLYTSPSPRDLSTSRMPSSA